MRRRSRLIRALIVVSAFVLLLAVPAVADVDNGGFESPVPTGAWDVFPSSQLGDWTVEWTEPTTACGGSAEPGPMPLIFSYVASTPRKQPRARMTRIQAGGK